MSHRLSPKLFLPTVAIGLVFSGVTIGQSPDSKAKPDGTISGRVTLNDKGAPDILVTATVDRPAQQPPRTRTDASGHYSLTGLPAGQYQINAIAPAFAIAERGPSSYSFYGPGKSVVLSAGEEVDDIDFKLARGGVITGRVTDADGRPVIDQRVNLQIVDQSGNPSRQPATIGWNYQMWQTDDRGIYRIYGLPAGRYRVSIGSNGEGSIGLTPNTRAYYQLTFYGDTTDVAKATIVDLLEGSEATNIDIRVGRAATTFVVSGRVIDADTGQSIAGIRLSYGPARPNQPFYGGYVGLPTGIRGEFRMEGVEPGRYGINVSSGFEASSFYGDPLFFEVKDGDVSNLELKLTRGLTLSGSVIFEGTRAKELQQQLSMLRIIANVVTPSSPQSSTSASAPIAGDGGFQIGGVRAGKVRLFIGAVSSPALRAVAILRVDRAGVDVTQNLELQPGESIADLRVVAGIGNGTIRGTVRVVGGALPSNVIFGVSARRENNTAYGFGLVDARGRFLLGNLISGTYEVMLTPSFNGPSSGKPIPPQKQMVNVSEDGETQVDFIVDLTPKEGAP